ncbi:carbonyl reductase [NADPH] 1 [Podospora aff. communis PSN243]|uniref:Carbonyl reductase [NADPH] 1 n=1 Tax=Podospora aff. communis PSN243 TaxID=3040156 RepID=A0AAV9GTW1_9PEZI|nr:carbonyl reductase [NADPH] 1 [Podospora aff. communis PSN243]
MSFARVGVVTGANKGIGYAIVRQLALQYPKSPLNSGPLLIYLTARDTKRGESAVTGLNSDPALRQTKALASDGGLTSIQFRRLDIASSSSISEFSAHLAEAHPDGIDFVINNAGMAMDGFDLNVVKKTLGCNYHGTLEATRAFLTLLKKPSGGRLVNVASSAGSLSRYSQAIQKRFKNAKSVDDITALMDEFTAAVERGTEKADGWPSAAYATSKAGEIGMTLQIAEELKRQKNTKVLVNACCPGWVVTDMTKGKGHKTPDQGAQTPVMLAISDIGGKSGRFWREEGEISW